MISDNLSLDMMGYKKFPIGILASLITFPIIAIHTWISEVLKRF